MRQLFWFVCWGLFFIWRILQEITFTWWRQARITSYFNLYFVLRADSAQLQQSSITMGKGFLEGKKCSLITPNLAFLNPCQQRNFNWKGEKNSLIFSLSYHFTPLLVQFWLNQNEHISLKTIFTASSMPLLMHKIFPLNTPTELIFLCPQIILPSITAWICLKIRKISWWTLGQMKINWHLILKIHCYK